MKKITTGTVAKGYKLLTVMDVAEMFQLSRRSVERLILDGEIGIIKIGKSTRILPSEIEAFINKQLK